MAARTASMICRTATTFTPDGELDEDAMRQFLQRFVDAKLGVYLASGGSGEGHALSLDEIRRVYEIGVEVCRGKVAVNSNQPELHTTAATIEMAQLAVAAGIEVINIYGPAGLHGYKASDEEYQAFFDVVLADVHHPVALCPNPIIGYLPSPQVIADIAGKHSQVSAINLSGITGDQYFVDLKAALPRDVETYVAYPGSLNMLALGATGILGAEANLIPQTFRRYLDGYAAGDEAALGAAYTEMTRVTEFVTPWKGTTPRWIKVAMKAFKLPGGEGGPRPPYLMPDDAVVRRFAEGAMALDVREISELARDAGLVSQGQHRPAIGNGAG
jgi:dihydrodipicolinate synthase/N-acetylneuraminate lyase